MARNRENTDAVIDRKMPGKAVGLTQRAALGNISNKTASTTDGVKVREYNTYFFFFTK